LIAHSYFLEFKMKRIFFILLFLLTFVAFLRLNAQWSKSYGGKNNDFPYSIRQTFDGGFIAVGLTESFGRADGDFWVLKLSPRGEIEWQNTYGGENSESAKCVQQTTDGGYIVAGSTSSFGAGSDDLLILKLSSDGEIEWQKTYGGSEYDEASSIQQTEDGGYIVAGSTSSFGAGYHLLILKLSSDGEVEWQKTYGGDEASSIQQTEDGGYIVAGSASSSGAGSDDLLIFKLSSDGEIEWQKTYGGSKVERATCIQQTMDGGYIVAGSITFSSRTEYNEELWILKLSPAGDIVWQHIYMGDYNDSAQSLQQTVDGGYIVAGAIGKYLYENFLVLKLSPDGKIEWQRAYGCSSGEYAYSIQQTDDGGYIVAGYTEFFGGHPHFWIFKLFPNGELPSVCDLAKTVSLKMVDTDIIPQYSAITPQDTNIIPQDSNISPNPTDATVYDFCSGKYFLNIEAWPGGTTDPLPGIYTYDPGTEVTIKATPSNGYFLEFWGGDASGDSNTITITMNSHKVIIAAFMPKLEGGESRNFGPCFVATAAYGSPLHPYVKLLRDFRDKYLIPKKLGRTLTRIYYRYSPPLADFMAKHKAMKFVVRVSLIPLIAFSYSMLRFGLIGTAIIMILIFALPALLVWRYRLRLKRHKAKVRDKN
jgi:uncharacterized delta-60 repeat protein